MLLPVPSPNVEYFDIDIIVGYYSWILIKLKMYFSISSVIFLDLLYVMECIKKTIISLIFHPFHVFLPF